MLKKSNILIGIFIVIFALTSCTFGKIEFRKFRNNNTNHQSNLRLNGLYFYESELNGFKEIHPIFLYEDGSVYSGINFSVIPVYDSYNRDEYINARKQTFDKIADFYKTRLHYESCRSSRWGLYRVREDSLYIKFFTQVPSGHIGLCSSKNLIVNDTTFIQLNHNCFQGVERNETRTYKFNAYPFKPDSTFNWTKEL